MAKRKLIRREPTPAEEARWRKAVAEEEKYKEATIAQAREVFAKLRIGRDAIAQLRAERERQGLSLADLKERTGMSRAAISKLENDECPNPTTQTLARLASALGMQLDIQLKRAR